MHILNKQHWTSFSLRCKSIMHVFFFLLLIRSIEINPFRSNDVFYKIDHHQTFLNWNCNWTLLFDEWWSLLNKSILFLFFFVCLHLFSLYRLGLPPLVSYSTIAIINYKLAIKYLLTKIFISEKGKGRVGSCACFKESIWFDLLVSF